MEPILSPDYWRERLAEAEELHHAVFRCPLDRWGRIEDVHRSILATVIQPRDSILDAGCGWGRLLDLLPADWDGYYLGVDISPDFLALARVRYPFRDFCVATLLDLSRYVYLDQAWPGRRKFDWAVCISIRPMVRRNLGGEVWDAMERELKLVAKQILVLEYDEGDTGEIL